MTANRMFTIRAVGVTAIFMAAAALALLATQPAAAAGWDTTHDGQGIDQQTVPEPAPPEGEQPGEGPVGDGAVAGGGSATPWVAIGIGVLLGVVLFAVYWTSRKPTAVDLDPDASLRNQDHRYIPPGM